MQTAPSTCPKPRTRTGSNHAEKQEHIQGRCTNVPVIEGARGVLRLHEGFYVRRRGPAGPLWMERRCASGTPYTVRTRHCVSTNWQRMHPNRVPTVRMHVMLGWCIHQKLRRAGRTSSFLPGRSWTHSPFPPHTLAPQTRTRACARHEIVETREAKATQGCSR
jgi:hypothetical protein